MGGATVRRDCLRVAAVGFACCLLVIHSWHLQPVVADGGQVDEAAEEFWKQFVEPTYPGSVAAFSPIQKAAFSEFVEAEKKRNLFKQSAIAAGVGGGLLGLLTPLLYTRSVSKSLGASPESKVSLSENAESLPVARDGSKGLGFAQRFKKAVTPSAKGLSVGTGVMASAMLLGSLGLLAASRLAGRRIREQRRKYRAVVAKQRQDIDKQRLAGHGDPAAAAIAAAATASPFSVDRVLSALQAGIAERGEQPTVTEPTVAEPTVAEPTVAEPTVAEPTVAEPTVAEPTVAEPTVAEPTDAELAAAGPTIAAVTEGLKGLTGLEEVAAALKAAIEQQEKLVKGADTKQ